MRSACRYALILVLESLSGCGFFFSADSDLSTSGSTSGGTTPGAGDVCSTASVTLEAVYPSNPKWNDYVRNYGGGSSVYDRPDVACDGTETGLHSNCLHAGEKRKFTLSSPSSCSGLSISDDLGLFNWTCRLGASGVTIYMVGLKAGKGLRDLIASSGTAFKSNAVTVTSSTCTWARSQSSVWWSNTVTPFPSTAAAAVTLSSPSTIYVLESATNDTGRGFNLNADKIGFVTLGNYTYKQNGSTVNCNNASGEAGASVVCTLSAGSQNFLWIEANISTQAVTGYSVILFGIKFSRIFSTRVGYNVGQPMFYLNNSHSNLLQNFMLSGGSQTGLSYFNSTYNVFDNVLFANQGNNNMAMFGTSTQNVFSRFIGARSAVAGIFTSIATVTNNTFNHLSMLGAGASGLDYSYGVSSSAFTTINNLLSINNNGSGLYLQNTLNVRLGDLALVNNSSSGISSSGSNSLEMLEGRLIYGGNIGANCGVGTASPTLNTICNYGPGLIYAPTVGSTPFGNAILGYQSGQDGTNQSNWTGALYTPLSDWLNFDNPYRYFGGNTPFANTFVFAASAPCTNNCNIWDARANTANSSNLGYRAFGAFTPNSTCPSSVHGNRSITDYNSITFLRHAVEVMNDGIGNDNALCESYEACIYAPNAGAYQGEGDYTTQSCSFQDAAVSGVTMYAYPIDGI